jgi:predicted transcriptional regulator
VEPKSWKRRPHYVIDVGTSSTYCYYMKAVQVTLDESLLAALDQTEDVARHGRSAVIRRAIAEYLSRHRSRVIRERYEAAYGSGEGVGSEFAGWAEQGEWPIE